MKSVPLKYLASITLGKMLQSKGVGTDQEVRPYLKASSITESGLDASELQTMPFSHMEMSNLSVRRNDVLVVEGGSIGRSAYIPQDMPQTHFQNSVNRVRPHEGVDGRYLNYAISMRLASGYFHSVTNQATIRHLTAEKLAATPIPLLSRASMSKVANYLDHETAEIDALMAEHGRLQALLAELRSAEISRTFPAFDQIRLKWVLETSTTGPFGTTLSASEYTRGGIPVINPTHIKNGQIVPDPNISVSEEKATVLHRFQLRAGDVILGRKGEVDKSALVSAELDGSLCGSDSMLLRPSNKLNPEYFWWFLQSPQTHSQLQLWSVGSTVQGLNQTTINRVVLPCPPLDVQHRIVAEINKRVTDINQLIEEASYVMRLARERRAALITTAVTGQIDVTAKAKPAAEQLEDDIAQGLHREN